MRSSSLLVIIGTAAIASAIPSTISSGPVKGNNVRVMRNISDYASLDFQDIGVKGSNGGVVPFQSNINANVSAVEIIEVSPEINDVVQCNAVFGGASKYLGIPVFDREYPLQLQEPQQVIALKCYRV